MRIKSSNLPKKMDSSKVIFNQTNSLYEKSNFKILSGGSDINSSAKVHTPGPAKLRKNNLKFQIFNGNNGALVKRVMIEGCPNRYAQWMDSGNTT